MWDISILGNKFLYIFYVFFAYSFFGWIYESTLVSIKKRSFVNRGFLNGPVIPIYGCGATLIFLVFWQYRFNYILVFVGGMCLATILEFITSIVMEVLFHTKWWDYSRYHFNIQGRICLYVSLLWGMLSVGVLHIFQPGINYLISRIPRNIEETLGYIIMLLFTTDIIVTIVFTIKLDHLLINVQKLRHEFIEYIENTKIYETKEELVEKLSNTKLADIFGDIRNTIEENIDQLKERYYNNNTLETAASKQEMETHVKEFFHKYHSFQTGKIHIRLIKAFPTMTSNRMEEALHDLKDKIAGKRVRVLNKELREEVTGRIQGYLSGFLRATIVGLLVILQFSLIIYLTFLLRSYTIYIYSFIEVLSIIIIIALVNDNRSPSYKISWICIILALPITGHIMYMLWGKQDSKKKIERKVLQKLHHGFTFLEYKPEVMEEFAKKYPTKSRMTRFLETYHFPLFKNNKIVYYPMGEDVFEAIFEEFEKAEHFILINFFIVGEGALWDHIHALLLRKIKEGVKVLFLYDDFGAMLRTPNNFKKNLEAEGFEIHVFNPIHKYTDKLYMNYRSHQKIIVIDGNVGFTGGINLADEYVNMVHRFGIWKDNAVKVEGEAVWGLTVTFLQMWEVSSEGELIDYNPYRPTKQFEENDVFCQIVSDGPANNPRNPIESIYKQIINYAKKYLYITSPYLIIEDDMRDTLITAAQSGVDVRIITPFIPDKKSVKIITNFNYGRLLEAGVRIFEYTPGFIHAKTIINEECGIVGTINMDYRSFYLHYECGVWMCNKEVIDTIKADLVKTMDVSREVTYEEWKNRPLKLKIYQLILNLFSTLM